MTDPQQEAPGPGRKKMSLGLRVLIGFVLGVACGALFGDLCAPLGIVGDTYVGLLQMTVLPYVALSITTRIGRLSLEGAARLGGRAGVTLLAFWGISLATVLAFAQSLPEWEAGSFFSPSLMEQPQRPDLVALYIPANVFSSLANNVVPAVVLFSICLGVALIPLPDKDRFLAPLEVGSAALGRITHFVVRLSPLGTFALTAHAAGTQSPHELIQIQAYVVLYSVAALFLALMALPLLVSSTTSIRYREVLSGFSSIGLTAFAIGKLFAVLTLIIDGVERILVGQGVTAEEARKSADLYVPLAYSFPNAGRLLTLLFLPFAGWFVGQPLGPANYPMLLSVGAVSLFGSPVAAIPFLLHMARLPADLFPLFLVSGIWCMRMGDVVGSMHLLAFTLIGSAASAGKLLLRPARLLRWLATTAGCGLLCIAGTRAALSWALGDREPAASRVMDVELTNRFAEIIEVADAGASAPARLEPGQTHRDRIRAAGRLRVAYDPDTPPFCYRSDSGELVGFDIDLIQRFAAELGAVLEVLACSPDDLSAGFAEDRFDLAVGGIPSSMDHFGHFRESVAYIETHVALVVEDHRVGDVESLEQVISSGDLRLAMYLGDSVERRLKVEFPELELVHVASGLEVLRGERTDVDALVTSAEVGAVYTMLFPRYAVIVPSGMRARFPLVIAIREDAPELQRFLDQWIGLKKADGTLERLYEYWILGQRPEGRGPRWSLVRDVFGWVK